MTYVYPKLIGYEWNALQKISIALKIPENKISIFNTVDKTIIGFNRELSEEEKEILDEIISNDPCSPPSPVGQTVFKIVDIWGMRQWFKSELGLDATLWFERENPDGSGECHMYLYFPRTLTDSEKDKVFTTFKSFISELI